MSLTVLSHKFWKFEKSVHFDMSRRENRNRDRPFDFIPIVKRVLSLLRKSETTEKEMAHCATQFREEMDKAQKSLAATPGLDMTEEEQKQKIRDLEEAIAQKEHLIAECQRCFESWKCDS